ncbi:MAG: methylated-DNA--[protein]-cysteine S-methyltransferase [Bacteroidales bacterium]|nr:methylated-DNA--[protein]-cysteine S-methyltransferase [Bacteroidales bacterium]
MTIKIANNLQPRLALTTYQSPIGELTLGEYLGRLCLCDWSDSPDRLLTQRRLLTELRRPVVSHGAPTPLLQLTIQALDEYFELERKDFAELPLLLCGTEFQRSVWEGLADVKWGATISYGQLAASIGRPTATRAVARACGANPICIILPCHRIMGSDGSLTGYTGGLMRKRELLRLESHWS